MKVMLLSFLAMGVISVVAFFGLRDYAGFSAAERTTVGQNVRLD